MLIQQVENPQNPGAYENSVRITMTKDQFLHLKDCVEFAFQNADRDPRMCLIATMTRKEFDNLKVKE